ncbi:MAG: DUF3867 domain-containing protein [Clostridium sp.]
MSDIIDFEQLKNKVKDTDIDKFENYMQNMYVSMSQGKLDMLEFSKEIQKYMKDNNISNEKLLNIQEKLMGRYGLEMTDVYDQMKDMGIDTSAISNKNTDYESMRKTMGFYDKYKERIKMKPFTIYTIKNQINDLEIFIEEENVTLRSLKKIDLGDVALNEFLCSYKKCLNNKALKICICDGMYEY